MALPPNFSEFENLQDLIRKEHNKAVKEWFKNQPDDDISTPKSRLKHTCLIKDEDSFQEMLSRMWLFEITVGHAQSIQAPIFAVPQQEVLSNWRYKPQVTLKFLEPYDNEAHNVQKFSRLEGEISFRLTNETASTISRANAERLARNIKQEFATPPFVWSKGWYKCVYQDFEKGYDFRLLVKSKAEGEQVVKQVLKIQNHTFSNDLFQFVEHDRNYPINPGTHRVYGKTVKKPVQRRRADVKFRYAQLLIPGLPNVINLVAVGTRLRSVIERV